MLSIKKICLAIFIAFLSTVGAGEGMPYKSLVEYLSMGDKLKILFKKSYMEGGMKRELLNVDLKDMGVDNPDDIKLFIHSKAGKVRIKIDENGIFHLPISARLYEENPVVKADDAIEMKFIMNKQKLDSELKDRKPGLCVLPPLVRFMDQAATQFLTKHFELKATSSLFRGVIEYKLKDGHLKVFNNTDKEGKAYYPVNGVVHIFTEDIAKKSASIEVKAESYDANLINFNDILTKILNDEKLSLAEQRYFYRDLINDSNENLEKVFNKLSTKKIKNKFEKMLIGFCNLTGRGAKKNSPEGIKFLEDSSTEYNLPCRILATVYEDGKLVDKDMDKARFWWRKSANRNDAESQLSLASSFIKENSEDSLKLAIEWMTKAAENESKQAALWLINHSSKNKNANDAVKWIKVAAENGSPQAQFKMYQMHKLGNYLPKNPQLAVNWLIKAAENGHGFSQYQLSFHYLKGQVVEKDGKSAFYWMKRAAYSGNSEAMYSVGSMYYQGNIIPKNNDLAFIWISQAAQQKSPTGTYFLAQLYLKGVAVQRNTHMYIKYLKDAAELGHIESMYQAGIVYYEGSEKMNLKRDYKEAQKWFKLAAQKGHEEAKSKVLVLEAFGYE